MPHSMGTDDKNIIEQCRKYQFHCTYDPEFVDDANGQGVANAIQSVLTERQNLAKRWEPVITRTDEATEALKKLIEGVSELKRTAENAGKLSETLMELYPKLQEKQNALEEDLSILREIKTVMERKNVRISVAGSINVGKSTFLSSALGDVDEKLRWNLFPSANAVKSCTGTRTILIYDQTLERGTIKVKVWFKKWDAFRDSCIRTVDNMIHILKKMNMNQREQIVQELHQNLIKLYESLISTSSVSEFLEYITNYANSGYFQNLCNLTYTVDGSAEMIDGFCSMIHFLSNSDFSRQKRENGISKGYFQQNELDALKHSWTENTPYSKDILDADSFEQVKKFVCKYDLAEQHDDTRYSTCFGVERVEIRGNLSENIERLELVDSIGANDPGIKPEEQIRILMQGSDAMILIERPPFSSVNLSTYVTCAEKLRDPARLYLVYNCTSENNNITGNPPQPSHMSRALDDAYHSNYGNICQGVYVSDIGVWEEVQAKLLVNILKDLSRHVQNSHENSLRRANEAEGRIHDNLFAIKQSIEYLKQTCLQKDGDASGKSDEINQLIQKLRGKLEQLAVGTEKEVKTVLRQKAKAITEALTSDFVPTPQKIESLPDRYPYLSPCCPEYMLNPYSSYLGLYSRMLEGIRRKYYGLGDEIEKYVNEKRQALMNILWTDGRLKNVTQLPDAANASSLCEWLREDGWDKLAAVFSEAMQGDIQVEKLIDESVGGKINRFAPKNLPFSELFGEHLSALNTNDNNEKEAEKICSQLSDRAKKLKDALLRCITEEQQPAAVVPQSQDQTQNFNPYFNTFGSMPQNTMTTTASAPPPEDKDKFNLDFQVRKMVCDGILRKFWDNLLDSTNGETAYAQLYNLYDRYYDLLLSDEEALRKKALSDARQKVMELSENVIVCLKPSVTPDVPAH